MTEVGRWMSTPPLRQPRVFNAPPAEGADSHYRASDASDSLRPSRRPGVDIDMSTLLDEVPPEEEQTDEPPFFAGELAKRTVGPWEREMSTKSQGQDPYADFHRRNALARASQRGKKPLPTGYDGPITEDKEKEYLGVQSPSEGKVSDYWYNGSLRKDYKHDDEWFNIGGFLHDDEDEETEY
jgi:hypothetical protein